MSRIKADLLLLLVSLVWGAAFVAQKDSFANIGAYTFVAARFLISLLLVLPLAVREYKRLPPFQQTSGGRAEIILLCGSFCAGVILQQAGIGRTTVTNAGFLTGLYVIFVPVICTLIYKQHLSKWIFPAAFTSIAGIWLLSGGRLDGFSFGDILVFGCAIGFGVQVTLVGRVMNRLKAPFILSCLQYAAVASAAIIGAVVFEHPTIAGIRAAAWPILYAGAVSGGIGYTLQIVAQQYTPASDSAIIMSGESVFAALFGALLLGERLTPAQYGGCALITLAIVLTELMPLVFGKKS
jgi:drug/metabolite transporter (DMT)-like permease